MATADKLIELFNEAKAKPAGAERERFLAECCLEDHLKQQVLSLLAAEADEGDSDFLKGTPLIRSAALITEKAGDRIGRYKLLELLGEGGCGVVYMAEQEEPVRRRVALKVLKLGMDTKSVIARFEAERQALALMDHANIAKFYDAGVTGPAESKIANLKFQIHGGRPFFVMELVRGIKITDYCDQNDLTTEQRLELFIQVCQAVQHAHQKGIIHRDLKPSNILVTRHDGVAVPKVIDFGIAKATCAQRLTDKTVFTAFEQFLGTPAYMSPEQAEMSGLDIDTRSDIYSLGVLLYELLTGTTPFDAQELLRTGLDEMRRIIRETEPPAPSRRVESLSELRVERAGSRGSGDSRTLNSRLKSLSTDLDWIVMKCLEKDRKRRYETANNLAMDISRHLNYEPVLARPPNNLYRLQKAIGRHQAAFVAAASIAVVLIVAVIVSEWQAIRARRAEREQIRLGQEARNANRGLRDAVSVLELQRAENFFRSGDAGTAVASLAAMLRRDPSNQVAASRLTSAMVHRNWALRASVTLCHTDDVATLSFSPDGRYVLNASRDQTAKIWDATTGKLVAVLPHAGQVFCANYDASGRRVVTASADGTARVWDAKTGEPGTPPLRHQGKVYWAEFSADERWIVTAGADATARIWDAATGALKQELRKHTSHVILARFSPDNKTVVTGGSHGSIRIWRADSGEMLFRMEDRQSPLRALAFSPDGRRLLCLCQDGIVRLWNLETRTSLDLRLENEALGSAAFSPDSRFVLTTSHDAMARLWDANTGLPVGSPLSHEGALAAGQFSFDGRKIVTLSKEHSARLWDTRTREPLCQPIREPKLFTHVDFSHDGTRLVIAGPDGTMQIWNIQPRRLAALETRFTNEITSIAFSANGELLLAAAWDGTARVVEARTGRTLSRLQHPAGLELAEFSPDASRVFSATTNATVQLWDWRKGAVIAGPFQHATRIMSARFHPRGDRVITGAIDGTARVWSAENGQPIGPVLKNQSALAFSPRFSPNGQFVITAGENDAARVWDASTGEAVTPPLGHEDQVRSADFSLDGKRIVTAAGDDTARVWDLRTGQLTIPPLQHTRLVETALFSPEGGRVLTTSRDRTARIWDVRTGEALTPPLKHDYALVGGCFTSDSEGVMTGCWNGALRVWDAKTGQPMTESLEAVGWIWRLVAFDPSGRRVATGGKDATLRLWQIPSVPTPVPAWFVTLTETVAGIRFGDRGQVEFVSREEYERAVRQLPSSNQSDFYARLARWLLADPAEREPTPF